MVVSLLERVAVPVTPIKSMLKPSGSPILNTQQKSARDAKIICQTEKENVARLQSIQIAGDSAEIPKHAPVQADTPKEMQGDTPTGVLIDTLFPSVTVSHDYYRISKPLFEGANGIIVKGAHKERKNDVVIIKIIKNSTDCCAERLRRLILNEFSVIRRCSHKNVVTVLDIAKLEVKDDQTANSSTDIMAMAHQPESLNGIAIVFPFYKHGDLLGFLCSLRRSHVEINASLKDSVFKQILKGVTYLHQNGIVHRDLKPENCLIDAQGVVKIADFSFSVVVSDEAAMRELNEVPEEVYVGTSSFKAPELFAYEHYINMAKGEGDLASEICNCISNITGKQPQITAEHLYRLDYWLLGVVYLNICTMQSPWNNANAYDLANFKYTDFEKNYPKTSTDLSRMVNDLNNNKITSFRNNPALNLFKSIHYDSRKHIIGLLNPQAKDRLTVQQVLDSPWILQVYANTRDLIALVEKKAR